MNRKNLTLFSIMMAALLTLMSTLMLSTPAVQAANAACKADNAAWIGSFGYGANCLDDAGWTSYEKGKSQLQSGLVNTIAACADGTTWISNALGLLKITAGKEEAIHSDIDSIEKIACDGKGGI